MDEWGFARQRGSHMILVEEGYIRVGQYVKGNTLLASDFMGRFLSSCRTVRYQRRCADQTATRQQK